MTDDILDAAQKAINDAASGSGENPGGSVPSPAEPPPVPVTAAEPNADSVILPVTPNVNTIEPPITDQLPVPPIPPIDQAASGQMSTGPISGATVVPPIASQHTTGAPKKKSMGALIAVIITLLLALPVGVYFIANQYSGLTETRSKATGINPYGPGYACRLGDPLSCGGHPDWCHCLGADGCTGTECVDASFVNSCTTNQGRAWCVNMHGAAMTCCQVGYSCCRDVGIAVDGCCRNGGPTGPTNTPRPPCTGPNCNPTIPPPTNPPNTPVATPTTGTSPVCQNIKIYKGTTQVTALNTLKAGDEVILAVKGNLTPSKAHFRINGAAWLADTTTKNGSNEFTQTYTIPAGVTDFQIEGEVFTNGAWR